MDNKFTPRIYVDNVTVLDASKFAELQTQYLLVAGVQSLDVLPVTPATGNNVCIVGGYLYVWDGTAWNKSGKPQVQSDWAEVDTTAPDFIKNKPAIPGASSTVPLMDSAGAVGTGTSWARNDHVHPSDTTKADKTALGSAAALDVGTAQGNIPVLVTGGKLPDSVLPSLAISEYVGTVSTQAQLVTLSSAQHGDYAVVNSDPSAELNGTWILNGLYSTLSDWIQISSPGGGTSGVSSVNGRTGVVTLGASDVSAIPNTATVNGKLVTSNPVLVASDVGAPPTSRTVNGQPLSSDIILSSSDVGAVPDTATVNGKLVTSNPVLVASDVGAVPNTATINGYLVSSSPYLTPSDVNSMPNPVVSSLGGPTQNLSPLPNVTYDFLNPLTTLNITGTPISNYETVLKFTIGTAASFTFTIASATGFAWLWGTAPTFADNKGYIISIQNNLGVWAEFTPV